MNFTPSFKKNNPALLKKVNEYDRFDVSDRPFFHLIYSMPC
ncbi:hypothetical protein SAMN03080601_03092 [Alkalitalea saponilacus]|uniref:Uncharacterized protein n=1 Tax=Alkalitalea saponilacus TaxID=889453 RepID=A0A1T5HT19_9BACT|nr:hypothetical protein SAMN03080601_03092 [Alkalitalea saponilacus]